MSDPDGYETQEGTAAFIVTHTSGIEVITDGYDTWQEATERAAEVYRAGDFPVTVDSTADGKRWAYGDDGRLSPAADG